MCYHARPRFDPCMTLSLRPEMEETDLLFLLLCLLSHSIAMLCGVGSLYTSLSFPVCLSDWDALSPLASDSCADWSRSPLAHGCRSTHNSPVHSACSSQRLSQNFSVSVPTLIFTGMKAAKTEGERAKNTLSHTQKKVNSVVSFTG